MTQRALTLHPIAADDHDDWCALYRGYAEFYQQPMCDATLKQVWQWLGEGRLHGVIARAADTNDAVGLAHWEFLLRPLHGVPLAYLHDLFVHPHLRGGGAGGELLAHFSAQARAHGCRTARWLTKTDNATARRLYDKRADAAEEWVLYQQAIEAQ